MGSRKLRARRKIRAVREFLRCVKFHVVHEIAPALLASCIGFLHFAGGESASPVK